MRKAISLLAAIALVTACSGGETTDEPTTSTADAELTTTTSAAPGTTFAPTTTVEPSTTTTQAATTTTVDPMAPEGSGCEPGTDDLPDGEWYGGVREFDASGIGFDLACLFTGEAAIAASAEDGEESPPPNDYYVRNQNEQVRRLDVAADTPCTWYTSGDPNDEVNGTFSEWVEFLGTQEAYLGIWVTIEGGQVTEITEWWVP